MSSKKTKKKAVLYLRIKCLDCRIQLGAPEKSKDAKRCGLCGSTNLQKVKLHE